MDYELSMALLALWFASTLSLFIAAAMFLHNGGEAFHPHSIVMDRRHKYFSVVGTNTECKTDFAVKSVSAYFAPRGSTSDKIFTVLIVLCAVAGFLGSVRWRAIDDASTTEAFLCQDKLLLTYWMMRKLKLQPYLDFKISPSSPQLVDFIRNSEDLNGVFEENSDGEMTPVSTFATFTLDFNLHAIGASTFVTCLTLAVILNDNQEHRVAYITGFFFVMFAAMGYCSGTYLPAAAVTRGMILIWNPFIREPDFLIKLQDAAIKYHLNKSRCTILDSDSSANSTPVTSSGRSRSGSRGGSSRSKSPARSSARLRRRRSGANDKEQEQLVEAVEEVRTYVDSGGVTVIGESERSRRARELLSTHMNMSWAHSAPKQYTRVLSHVMVTVELAAMITPIIAIGVQWMVSSCESSDTPHTVFFDALFAWCQCMWTGDNECAELQQNCIMFTSNASAQGGA